MENLAKRENWGSRFGALMAMAGMAIGLGNVWRFPYMVGSYGGGAFVVAYLICLSVVVIPLAVIEAGIGKGLQGGVIDTYTHVFKNSAVGKVLGGASVMLYTAMNFFFIAVLGISLYFMYASAVGMWDSVAPEQIYDQVNTNTTILVVLLIVLTLFIGYVVYKGIQSGIEAVSKVMVPGIFLFFLITILFAIFSLPNIADGYNFYLNPDWSRLAHTDIWVAAMGQALFSVGVGPGCVLVYGSHIKRKDDVTLSIFTVCLLDTCAALFAGFAMIPAAIALGIDPESGARLIFVVLPAIFAQIPFGNLLGVLVFSAVFFAGITSAIAQLEVPVTTFTDAFKWPRGKTVIALTILTLACSIPAVYSETILNMWSDLAGNYGFIVTAGIGAIAFNWVYGTRKVMDEFVNPTSHIRLGAWFSNFVKFVGVPIMIVILANSIFGFL